MVVISHNAFLLPPLTRSDESKIMMRSSSISAFRRSALLPFPRCSGSYAAAAAAPLISYRLSPNLHNNLDRRIMCSSLRAAMSGTGGGGHRHHHFQAPKVTNKVYMKIELVREADAADGVGVGLGVGGEQRRRQEAAAEAAITTPPIISETDTNSVRIEIELYGHLLPTIVQHFRLLCTAATATGTGDMEFSYRGSKFSRLTRQLIQGGNVDRTIHDAGTNITIAYPHYTIQDLEKKAFGIQTVDVGSVAMRVMHNCTADPNYTTYGSEFVILTSQAAVPNIIKWTDIPVLEFDVNSKRRVVHEEEEDKDVDDDDDDEEMDGMAAAVPVLGENDLVFGKVSKGMDKLEQLIKLAAPDPNHPNPDGIHPSKYLLITDCGEITNFISWGRN